MSVNAYQRMHVENVCLLFINQDYIFGPSF